MAVTIGDGKIPPEVVRAAADQTLPLNPADAVHVRKGVKRRNLGRKTVHQTQTTYTLVMIRTVAYEVFWNAE